MRTRRHGFLGLSRAAKPDEVKFQCRGLHWMRQIELAWVAQLVERVLGKDEVTGSIPVPGSRGRLDEQAGRG